MMFLGIILIIILAIKLQDNNNNVVSKEKSSKALDILGQHLANGEITEDEYKRKKKLLE